MRSVRIIFAGLLCGIVSSSRADIASVQYVESVIPTVNDATLTIQKNGSTVDTFTANSASNKTVNITVPTTAADVSAVPTTRTVNTKALSSDVTLSGGDIAVTGYSKPGETGAIEATDTVNAAIGKLEKALDAKQASGSYVPTTTTVNTKALSSDITLDGADVKVTGYAKADSAAAVTANDTVNQAIGKLEKALDGKQASGDYVQTTRTVNSKALSSDITLSASDVGAVPTSRTVNTKALSSDVTLNGGDIAVTGYSKPSETGAIEATDTVNAAIGKLEKALEGKQASGSYVPTTTTVNSKALSSNITLDGADVALTGYSKAANAAAVDATDTVNAAIGKLEKTLDGKVTANSAITGATKTKITYDAKGLVTAGADLDAADIPNIATSKVNALTGYTKGSSDAALADSDTLNAALSKLENQIDGKQAAGSYVPTTTTVNSKALSSNITLDGADVALTGYSKAANAAAVAASDTVNQAIGKLEKALDGKQASGDYVVNTTTVNGHALSSNVTVSKSDVGLGNVANVDTTNASNISSGTLDVARLPVGTTSTTVAAGNDARFNTIATSQPSGTPPTGTVFIWFDSGN